MSFHSLLIHKCDVLRRTFDENSRATEVVVPDVPCRISHKLRVVKVVGVNGVQDVQSPTGIDFEVADAPSMGDRLRFDGRAHGILEIQKPSDSQGYHHVIVRTD